MIGIDTLSWGKFFDLFSTNWKDLVHEILLSLDIFITIEVRKELIHHYQEQLSFIEKLKVYPILNKTLRDYLLKGFDLADATLLEYSELPDYVIITEDNEMLLEGITDKNNVMQLYDLLLELSKHQLISKKEMHHLTKYFRKNRNITHRKEIKSRKEFQ